VAQRGRKTNLKRLAQVAELEELRGRSRPENPHLNTRGKKKLAPSRSRPDKPWLFTGKKRSARGERNIAWVEEYLRVPEGKFAGDPLRLPEFMKEDFRAIYDNPDGTRRAIISRGRKNAKTTEAAMLVLLHLCGPEGYAAPHAQLYSAAQSRDQAALIFNLAAKMIRLDRALFDVVTIRETNKLLQCPFLENVYRALSAEATTAFGLSPCLIVHDELGQVRGPRSRLYEALETATAAQANPLSVIISTQAPNEADLLSLLIDDASAGHDPKTVLRFNCAGPEHKDPFTEAAIRAANPAVEIFMNKDEVLSMAANARRMPARQAEFENLVLNRRVETNNPFVSAPLWRACGGEVADLTDIELYGGLDLSAVADLTSLVLIGKVERAWHVLPTFWLPEEGLAEKAARDHVPYDTWKTQGFLQTTPGNAISYEYVAAKLFGLFSRYRIRKIGFDRWGMKFLKPWLLQAGFTETLIEQVFVEVGQGTMSMTPALRDLEQAVLQRELRHGNQPVLAMCAAQAIVEGTDSARKLSKARSIGRIDGMVALAMAFSVAPLTAPVIDINALIG
jgi:phage terminase large subunit-like protein